MSQLIQIRNEIEKGDYRSLYIGFLLAISIGLPDEDTMEPPVPPGLASPTASQESLIEFLEIEIFAHFSLHIKSLIVPYILHQPSMKSQ